MSPRLPLCIAGPIVLAAGFACSALIALAVTHPLIGLSVIAVAAAVVAGVAWLGRVLDTIHIEREG